MKTIADRMKEAMSLKNIKQIDLVAKTGIGKSSISQYLSGVYEPKKKNLYLIAKALDVNEDWLLGKEVPMDRKQFFFPPDSELLKNFSKISEYENIPIDLLIDAFTQNTNYINIKPVNGRDTINYDNIHLGVKQAFENRLSDEAFEIAEAYDDSDIKTKNIIRLILDLPVITLESKDNS